MDGPRFVSISARPRVGNWSRCGNLYCDPCPAYPQYFGTQSYRNCPGYNLTQMTLLHHRFRDPRAKPCPALGPCVDCWHRWHPRIPASASVRAFNRPTSCQTRRNGIEKGNQSAALRIWRWPVGVDSKFAINEFEGKREFPRPWQQPPASFLSLWDSRPTVSHQPPECPPPSSHCQHTAPRRPLTINSLPAFRQPPALPVSERLPFCQTLFPVLNAAVPTRIRPAFRGGTPEPVGGPVQAFATLR